MNDDVEQARLRRLARLKEQSKPELPDPSVEEARLRRLEREKSKPVKEETPEPEKPVIRNGTAVSDANKGSIYYFEKNWTVELHTDQYVFYADGKKRFHQPTKNQEVKKNA